MDLKVKCSCTKQIVWFYEKPTVLVCEDCETAHSHYNHGNCPNCGKELTEFVKKESL